MSANVIIGLQWGDEGKGKIIDVLAEEADVVVRFQGGNNAGHTIHLGADKFVLHLIPSGVLRDDSLCVIANGMVVDPLGLVDEITALEAKGREIRSRLKLSSQAHLVFKCHKIFDSLQETHSEAQKIGTTQRGIGPCYADKASRTGLRLGEFRNCDQLKPKFFATMTDYNRIFQRHDIALLDEVAEWQKIVVAAAILTPLIDDTVQIVNQALISGKTVLFEGAQGAWLDIDHGTYPYVTSSNTSIGGVCTGAGIAPQHITSVMGVAKAYTTRVGEGPFPTELSGDVGDELRKIGKEFGATTGRPRRCGWFDIIATRHAVMVNGVTSLAITKLDVLSVFDIIKIGVGYTLDGQQMTRIPADIDEWSELTPIYEEHPGWRSDISNIKNWEHLPVNAQNYVNRLARLLDVRVAVVSVGPGREQTFYV